MLGMPSEMAKFETGPTKSVQCSVCNKKFSRTDHLKRHQLRRKDHSFLSHDRFCLGENNILINHFVNLITDLPQ